MYGSEVSRGCLALFISVVYGQRALPLAWVVVRANKGHFPADTHVRLQQAAVERMPFTATASRFAPIGLLGAQAMGLKR